jgi:hypothetical protein
MVKVQSAAPRDIAAGHVSDRVSAISGADPHDSGPVESTTMIDLAANGGLGASM